MVAGARRLLHSAYDSAPARVDVGPMALQRISAAYEDLGRRTNAPLTARMFWLEPWFRAFKWEPLVVSVPDRAGGLAAAAVLARRRSFGATSVVNAGLGVCDEFRMPALTPDAATALADGIVAAVQAEARPWRLHLEQVAEADTVLGRIHRRLAECVVDEGQELPRLRLDRSCDPDSYGSRSFRAQVRRARRAAGAAGVDVRFDYVSDPTAIGHLLPTLQAIRARRDREALRVSSIETGAGVAYWRGIITAAAATSRLETAVMRCNGGIAAFALVLLDGSDYSVWDPRMNPAWARFSPGVVLHADMVARAHDDPRWKTVNFMRGATPLKLRIATEQTATRTLTAWSSPAARRREYQTAMARARVRGFAAEHSWAEQGYVLAKRAYLRLRTP